MQTRTWGHRADRQKLKRARWVPYEHSRRAVSCALLIVRGLYTDCEYNSALRKHQCSLQFVRAKWYDEHAMEI